MSGIGLGLFEYAQKEYGSAIRGLNFSSSLPLTPSSQFRPAFFSGSPARAPAPDVLAFRLLQAYEDGRIRHPVDSVLREDLRTPERLRDPSGRCSVHTPKREGGHADHFWSFALALEAARQPQEIYLQVVPRRTPFMRIDRKRLM